MSTAEERIQILKMVQSRQINAEEGAQLLEALKESQQRKTAQPESTGTAPRQLHVRVTDLETGRQKVDMHIPWSLVNAGIHMGARFARREIDVQDFVEAVQAGASGKVVDVIDEEDRERVEIFVE
jgi:polyhydroxyalkanoate synthesis regulator phasin